MDKKICAYLFVACFIVVSKVVHGQPASLSRTPSVEPIAEIDIQDPKALKAQNEGYDFGQKESQPSIEKRRIPANIVTKEQATAPSNYLGPIIFLITLPFAVWLMVSKKFSQNGAEKTVEYYPKTKQFHPFKTDYQKSAEDDDDIDFPKAS